MTWLDRGEKWAVIIGTLVALGGLVYSAMKETKAVQIEQRAWIGVSQWELDREPEDGSTITVRTTVVNKGNSPAIDVVSKARLSVLGVPIFDAWELIPGRNPTLIFPETVGQGFNTTVRIPVGTSAAYRSGQLKVWITGRISYLDAFGRPHWTTFCAYHTADQDLQLFAVCETGNDLDRERY